MQVSERYPIPIRLNLALGAAVALASVGLLAAGSRLPLAWSALLGLVLSFVLLTNYALMHEAAHDVLHPDARVNRVLGSLLSWLFPMPFTVFRVSHVVHHCCNRTDHEMFDYYYPGDSRAVKYAQWYGLLLGLWWPLIPLGSALLALSPRLLRTRVFKARRTTAVLFDDFDARTTRRMRGEAVGLIGFWGALALLADLRMDSVALMYACFGVNWSTRQYVTHAFTPREVRDGAWNLALGRTMGWVLLNGHWDREHHRHPHVPWVHLPSLADPGEPRPSYLGQYLGLWRGPRPAPGPGPSVLPRVSYERMA